MVVWNIKYPVFALFWIAMYFALFQPVRADSPSTTDPSLIVALPKKMDNARELSIEYLRAIRPRRSDILDKIWSCKEYRWFDLMQMTTYYSDLKIQFTMDDWDLEKRIIGNSSPAGKDTWDSGAKVYVPGQYDLSISKSSEVFVKSDVSIEYYSTFRILKNDADPTKDELIGELTVLPGQEKAQNISYPPKFYLVCSIVNSTIAAK